jgi:RNA polymerase sigma factor for flagellar operon FliA
VAVMSALPSPIRPITGLSGMDRERMILDHAPLVRRIVGRLLVVLPQALGKEDLLGYGTIGLIEAVDRYDASYGVSFDSFATGRIKGSIIDALRAADWVPRSSRKRAKDIQTTFADLEEKLGRAPELEEVAGAMSLTPTQMHRAMADAVSSFVSLQRPIRTPAGEEGTVTLMDIIADDTAGPAQVIEERELRQYVVAAIRRLDEREQLVLSLYYEKSLTLREIGKVLEICESRVWQLHARAIMRIRAYVNGSAEARKDPKDLKKVEGGK